MLTESIQMAYVGSGIGSPKTRKIIDGAFSYGIVCVPESERGVQLSFEGMMRKAVTPKTQVRSKA